MELKKCPRCGNFYTTELEVCQNCKTNESLDVEKVKGYIEQYGISGSIEEIAISTGVNVKNISRYLKSGQSYGISGTEMSSSEVEGFSGSEVNL